MKPFIHADFLLHSNAAQELYHHHAADLPLIDYHSHLPPAEVVGDQRWENLTQLWLSGDHYKWRALRSNGVAEELITGAASDRAKFDAFAATMPYLWRNPLFDWAQLELARYFDITTLLTPETADAIWEETREKLSQPGFSARGFMERSRVEMVCTTDDPCDTLEHHLALRESGYQIKMLPSWRPDRVLQIDRVAAWNEWLGRLEAAAGVAVDSYSALLTALERRHDHFQAAGCRLSDYGMETLPEAEAASSRQLAAIFDKVRSGKSATAAEVAQFQFELLATCGAMDRASGWSWQLHYGVIRNNSSRIMDLVGPDAGCDSISDRPVARAAVRLFDRLDRHDQLPRTIIYNLNPRDNELLVALIGNFQRGPTPGKMQFGSGWWFNDQKDGIRRQIEALSQMGLLSRFVGMLTDSRSFTSFTRHDYFRRILCNIIGAEIERGELPHDMARAGQMVADISYHNAKRYFFD